MIDIAASSLVAVCASFTRQVRVVQHSQQAARGFTPEGGRGPNRNEGEGATRALVASDGRRASLSNRRPGGHSPLGGAAGGAFELPGLRADCAKRNRPKQASSFELTAAARAASACAQPAIGGELTRPACVRQGGPPGCTDGRPRVLGKGSQFRVFVEPLALLLAGSGEATVYLSPQERRASHPGGLHRLPRPRKLRSSRCSQSVPARVL